jgi:hypothetical protein
MSDDSTGTVPATAKVVPLRVIRRRDELEFLPAALEIIAVYRGDSEGVVLNRRFIAARKIFHSDCRAKYRPA